MRSLPPRLRRILGAACLGWPLIILLGPFPIPRVFAVLGLLLLASMLLLLPATGLQEDLAWRVLFAGLAPVAWMAPDPGRWWMEFARRCEDTRLLEGALDRGESWGSDEAAFEIALNHLSSGVPGIQAAGVLRLHALGARGHREALETLAGCMAWSVGTALDVPAARALWIRLGGGAEETIPPPRPGLYRRAAARAESGLEGSLGAGIARAGEATRHLLQRSAPARAGLWIAAGAVLLFLLAIPLSFMASNLAMGGLMGAATGLILLVVGAMAAPALGLLLIMAVMERASTRQGGAARRLRRRAETGDAESCFRLGEDFDRGAHHAPKDSVEARRWYQAAAERGHAEAAFRLGEMMILGFGGAKDRRAGLAWWERAAEAGHAAAATRWAEATREPGPLEHA